LLLHIFALLKPIIGFYLKKTNLDLINKGENQFGLKNYICIKCAAPKPGANTGNELRIIPTSYQGTNKKQ